MQEFRERFSNEKMIEKMLTFEEGLHYRVIRVQLLKQWSGSR